MSKGAYFIRWNVTKTITIGRTFSSDLSHTKNSSGCHTHTTTIQSNPVAMAFQQNKLFLSGSFFDVRNVCLENYTYYFVHKGAKNSLHRIGSEITYNFLHGKSIGIVTRKTMLQWNLAEKYLGFVLNEQILLKMPKILANFEWFDGTDFYNTHRICITQASTNFCF